MRVLHVVESLQPQAGSVAVSLSGLFRALLHEDIAVSCLVAEVSPNDDRCDHLAASDTSTGGAIDVVAGANLEQALADADLVHIHGWEGSLGRSVASAARKRGLPVVLAPLGALSESSARPKSIREKLRHRLSNRSVVRSVSVLAAMHEQEAATLADCGDRIEVLPYGLDAQTAAHSSVDDHQPEQSPHKVLLFLGPIDPAEGVVMLLKSFAEIGGGAGPWRITLAGPRIADWRSQLEAAVERKGAGDRVRFQDALDVVTQHRLLDSADVVVAPSLSMRFPLAAMQAAIWGVPVLATTCATPHALGEAIRTCPPKRGEFKMALRALLATEDSARKGAGLAAQAVAREALHWDRCIDPFIQLYRSLV